MDTGLSCTRVFRINPREHMLFIYPLHMIATFCLYRCICGRPQEVPLYIRYVKLSREYAQITKRDCHRGGRFAYDPNVNCMIDEPVC